MGFEAGRLCVMDTDAEGDLVYPHQMSKSLTKATDFHFRYEPGVKQFNLTIKIIFSVFLKKDVKIIVLIVFLGNYIQYANVSCIKKSASCLVFNVRASFNTPTESFYVFVTAVEINGNLQGQLLNPKMCSLLWLLLTA